MWENRRNLFGVTATIHKTKVLSPGSSGPGSEPADNDPEEAAELWRQAADQDDRSVAAAEVPGFLV